MAIPGSRRTVDIAFPKVRVAVDVRGCYWHSCPIHGTQPKANGGWWASKFKANMRRDGETLELLVLAGWTVMVVWEHDDPRLAATAIEDLVRAAR